MISCICGWTAHWRRLVLMGIVSMAFFLAAPGVLHAQDEPWEYTGRLEIVWGDKVEAGAWQGSSIQAYLVTEAGDRLALEITPDLLAAGGGTTALQGATVTVQGRMSAAGQLEAQSLTPSLNAAASSAAIQGSYPWVVLLCRGEGANIAHEEPLAYYEELMGGKPYGIDHYWREQSYGKANVLGSGAVGWLDLPAPASAYQVSFQGGVSIDMDKSFADCTAAADSFVDFTLYRGIALFVPVPPVENGGIWFFGGGRTVKLDGKSRFMSVVWMPSEIADSWQSGGVGADILVHEMGHGFGLPHSSGPYDETYDSAWDVMSMSGGSHCYREPVRFGCAGQHTIAVHKEWLGWLASGQVLTLADKSSAEIVLQRLAQPAANGVMMVKAPISGTPRYYTVEARQLVGYDKGLDAEAVIVHEVDPSRTARPAQVVDPDGNGDPNDEGAQWEPGERFTGEGGFRLCVKARRPEGFVVVAARNQALTCTFAPDLSPSELWADTLFPSAGQTVTVQIDLVNYQAPATNLVVTATVPSATTYVSRTATMTQGRVTFTNTNQLVFRVGELTYQKPVTLSYEVVVKPELTGPTVIAHSSAVAWDQGTSTLQMQWIVNAQRLHMPFLRR
jgi:M6 family metalloprotease-like protein/uncharacterized repeat protein (TIGR01451 family)